MSQSANIPSFIQSTVSLKPYNTFGIDVQARYFAKVSSVKQLIEALNFQNANDLALLPIGGGSNILFMKDFDGLVLKLELKGVTTTEVSDSDFVLVTAAAGENWHEFVIQCLENGWFGLENLSLIPGCVGAAPMQNIGAYGVETKDVFHHLEALDLETNEIIILDKEQCQFGYRESVFKHELKGKTIILSVTFLLRKNSKINTQYGAINDILKERNIANPTPKDVSNAVIHIRQSKLPDPAVTGNAGSFFKNPEVPISLYQTLLSQYPSIPSYPTREGFCKIPAGWLIEQAGWKGHNRITHGVHPKQALVLVNYGEATGQDIYTLAQAIQKDVLSKFNVELEMEVNRE